VDLEVALRVDLVALVQEDGAWTVNLENPENPETVVLVEAVPVVRVHVSHEEAAQILHMDS